MLRIGSSQGTNMENSYYYIIWYVVSAKDHILEVKELKDLLSIISNNPIQDIQRLEKISISPPISHSNNYNYHYNYTPIEQLSDKILKETYLKSLELHKKQNKKIQTRQLKLLKLLEDKIYEREHPKSISGQNPNEEIKQKENSSKTDSMQIEGQKKNLYSSNKLEQSGTNNDLPKIIEGILESIGLSFENFNYYSNNEFFFKKDEITYVLKFTKQITPINEKENILYSAIIVFTTCKDFNTTQHGEFQSSLFNAIKDCRGNILVLKSRVKNFLPIFERCVSAAQITLDYSLESVLRIILRILKEEKCHIYKKFVLESTTNSVTSESLFLYYSSEDGRINKNKIIECFTKFLTNSSEYLENIGDTLYQQIQTIKKLGKYVLIICKQPHNLYYRSNMKLIQERILNIKLVCILAGNLLSNPKVYLISSPESKLIENDTISPFRDGEIEKVNLLVYENLV